MSGNEEGHLGHYEGWLFVIRSHRVRRKTVHLRYFILDNGQAFYYKEAPSKEDEAPLKCGDLDPSIHVEDCGREMLHGRALYVFKLGHPRDADLDIELGADTAENAAQWMLAFRHHMQLAKGLSGAPNVPGSNTTIGSSSSGSQAKGKPARASRARHKDEDGPALAAATWQPPGGFAMTWTESLRSASQDVVSHSNWDIVDCVNGLRIFKERTTYGRGKKDPQVLMAVGVMPASSERVFDTIMALGSSRLEWDYTMQRCQLVEHVDGHTDIIHKVLRKQLFAWSIRPRDLLLGRYWRREEDGTYVVLYSSVEHARCPPCKGYTRASVLSGGYVITPLQQGRGVSSPSSSVMKHMMEVDWRGCARRRPQLSRAITMHVLHRIAALREMLAASNNFSAAPASVDEAPAMHAAAPEAAISEAPAAAAAELSRLQQLKPHLRITPPRPFGASPSHKTPRTPHHDPARPPPGLPAVIPGGTPRSPHTPEPRISGQLGYGFLESEGVDEYFDVAEDFRLSGSGSVGEMDGGGGGGGAAVGVASAEEALLQRQEVEGLPASSQHEREDGMMFSTAALVVRRLQGLARKKAARRESAGRAEEEVKALALLGSLEPGLGKSSWGNPEASIFFVRGHSYLVDKLKVPAGDPLAQLAAVDWFTSDRREDHVACRPGTIIQRKGGDKGPFCFVVNLQVPGASTYSLVLYYMLRRQLAEVPLLQMFVEGDNQLRNSRFKLIPNVAKGSWLVKQSVGKKACLVGEALHVAYFRGRNYLELDIDVGSSSIARGVVGLVLRYVEKLVLDLAFLIQGESEEHLPEQLLGTVQICHLEPSKAVPPPPAPGPTSLLPAEPLSVEASQLELLPEASGHTQNHIL